MWTVIAGWIFVYSYNTCIDITGYQKCLYSYMISKRNTHVRKLSNYKSKTNKKVQPNTCTKYIRENEQS